MGESFEEWDVEFWSIGRRVEVEGCGGENVNMSCPETRVPSSGAVKSLATSSEITITVQSARTNDPNERNRPFWRERAMASEAGIVIPPRKPGGRPEKGKDGDRKSNIRVSMKPFMLKFSKCRTRIEITEVSRTMLTKMGLAQ
jgi:hypothetical protein